MNYLNDFKRMALGRPMPGLDEGIPTPTNTDGLVDVLNSLQKSLRAYAAKISGTPDWKSYGAVKTATTSPMAQLDLMANHQDGDIVTMDRIRMDLRFWGDELVQTLEVSRLVRDLRFQQRADVKAKKSFWAAEDDLDPAKLTAAALLDATKPFWAEVRGLKPKALGEADIGKALPGAQVLGGGKVMKGGAVMNPESRAALEKLLWKWMPTGNKLKVGGAKKFMATGDFAKKMKMKEYDAFTVADLSDAQVTAMMQFLAPKAESRQVSEQTFFANSVEKEDYDTIIKNLLAGYEKDGVQGLMLAAYKLESKVHRLVFIGVLKELTRTGMLDGEKIEMSSKDAWSINHYVDDLKLGK